MKTAIIYNSENEKNTKKILDAIQEKYTVDLYDASQEVDCDFYGYDYIGVVTDTKGNTVDKPVVKMLKRCLPTHKHMFIIYMARSANNHYIRPITECAKGKNIAVDGIYFCSASYENGFTKIFHKNPHPNKGDLERVLTFYESIVKEEL